MLTLQEQGVFPWWGGHEHCMGRVPKNVEIIPSLRGPAECLRLCVIAWDTFVHHDGNVLRHICPVFYCSGWGLQGAWDQHHHHLELGITGGLGNRWMVANITRCHTPDTQNTKARGPAAVKTDPCLPCLVPSPCGSFKAWKVSCPQQQRACPCSK